MALIEQLTSGHGAARSTVDAPTIDGMPLTPKAVQLAGASDVRDRRGGAPPPQAEARRRAAHLRTVRVRRGRRRPHHGPRPRVPRPLLGQPVRPQLPPHAGQRPHPRQPRRRRGLRRPAGQPGRVRDPRRDPPGPPRRRRRRPLPLAVRQVVRLARHPARPADPGRLHLLRGPHRDHRAGRRSRVRHRRRQGDRRGVPQRQGGDPPEPRSVHRRRDASTRPCSGSSRWSAPARPS